MLGLSALDIGRVRLSVGYGTHKKGRPLSPIEVGEFLRKARDVNNVSIKDCANAIGLNNTVTVSRFLRILDLPSDLHHLISWGGGKGSISFSCAFELARNPEMVDQRAIAESVLANTLKSQEVRQISQLRKRSGRPIQECINEVLGMRTIIEKRYVFIGSIADKGIESKLGGFTQAQRNSALKVAIYGLNIQGATGRLGQRIFTLVGGGRFNTSMRNIGQGNLEAQFRTHIAKAIENVKPGS